MKISKLKYIIPLLFFLNPVNAENKTEIYFGQEDFSYIFDITNLTESQNVLQSKGSLKIDGAKEDIDNFEKYIKCESNRCFAEIPIDNNFKETTDIRVDVMLNTSSSKKNYTEEFMVIPKETIEYEKMHDDIQNINNQNIITIKYKLNNLSNTECTYLKFELLSNNKSYPGTIKNNTVKFTVPVSDLNDQEELNYDIYLINSNIEAKISDTIKIEDKIILNKFQFGSQLYNTVVNTRRLISPSKDPYSYKCTNYSFEIINQDIAEVDKDGYIVSKAVGVTPIKATCDNKIAMAFLNVEPEPVEINFKAGKHYIEVDKTKEIPIKISPESEYFKRSDVYWYTSDFILAATDNEGNITGYNEGQVDVTMFYNGEEKTISYDVIPKVEEIVTNIDNISLEIGQQVPIAAKTLPVDISEYEKIDFSFTNQGIASYVNGSIIGLREGETELIFTHDDVKTSIPINVTKKEENMNDFAFSNSTITLNPKENYKLEEIFIPLGIEYDQLAFISIDPTIASIKADGKITANKQGNTLVIIKSKTTTQYIEVIVK